MPDFFDAVCRTLRCSLTNLYAGLMATLNHTERMGDAASAWQQTSQVTSMKKLLIACMLLGAGPALAQNPLTTTQNPPAGTSSESTPQPTNSLPQGAGTERPTQQPGSTVGITGTQPTPAVPMTPSTPR